MIDVVLTATAAFVATNIDDILVLSVLFARRDGQFGARQIVLGQYLGFSVLVAASIAVSAGLLALPEEAVGVLALIPIGLGVHGFYRAIRAADEPDGADEVPERAAMSTIGVATLTIANGADNIAIYAPLFATIGPGGLTATLGVFAVLVGVWCAVGKVIGTHPAVMRLVDWAGGFAIPAVLIGLGLFILIESGLLSTIFS